jgi:hypothetical protein
LVAYPRGAHDADDGIVPGEGFLERFEGVFHTLDGYAGGKGRRGFKARDDC